MRILGSSIERQLGSSMKWGRRWVVDDDDFFPDSCWTFSLSARKFKFLHKNGAKVLGRGIQVNHEHCACAIMPAKVYLLLHRPELSYKSG